MLIRKKAAISYVEIGFHNTHFCVSKICLRYFEKRFFFVKSNLCFPKTPRGRTKNEKKRYRVFIKNQIAEFAFLICFRNVLPEYVCPSGRSWAFFGFLLHTVNFLRKIAEWETPKAKKAARSPKGQECCTKKPGELCQTPDCLIMCFLTYV